MMGTIRQCINVPIEHKLTTMAAEFKNPISSPAGKSNDAELAIPSAYPGASRADPANVVTMPYGKDTLRT